jgi:hypothetical protein
VNGQIQMALSFVRFWKRIGKKAEAVHAQQIGTLRMWRISLVVLLAVFALTEGKTIYVDDDANGLNSGTNWQNAYKFLQDALADANSAQKPVEIRIGTGIYKPDRSSAEPNGTRDRTATFRLINGVTIKGGYVGSGEPDPNARDIDRYETILSGDLAGNDTEVNDPCDLLTEPTRDENIYHVVTAIRKDTALDGFTITGGNANGPSSWEYEYDRGGGIYIDTTEGKSLMVSNCTLRTNSSLNRGGGIYFTSVGLRGPTLTNCTFIRNWAGAGGGVYDGSGFSPVRMLILTNCRFISNSAVKGGGIYIAYSRPTLTNCMFIGNLADFGGAAGHYDSAITTYSKCTFAANSAEYGRAISCSSWDSKYPNIVRLKNCIIWDGGEEVWNNNNSDITIRHSDVQGSWPGKGNINADPCFADVKNGDYHLKSQAGRWDANEGRWTKDDVTSPCIDAGDPASPIGYEPFPNGGIINMGAYGGTAEASKSYFGEPICETIIASDINGDCKVNFRDLAFMAFHWLEDRGPFDPNCIITDGIEYYIHTDKHVYELGEYTEILYRITNLTDEVWVVSRGAGRARDVLVEAKEGENFRVVWRFNWEYPIPPGPGEGVALKPGESAERKVLWPQFDMKGPDLGDYTQTPPGIYRITGTVDGYRIIPEPRVEIHIRVSVNITVVY